MKRLLSRPRPRLSCMLKIAAVSMVVYLSWMYFFAMDPKINLAPIMEAINSIYADCGELCHTNRPGTEGKFFNEIFLEDMRCEAIFSNAYVDDPRRFVGPALRRIPGPLWDNFTMQGRVEVSSWYFDLKYLGAKAKVNVWGKDLIEKQISQAKERRLKGTYNYEETNSLMNGLALANLSQARVLVVGSEEPWVEAACLASGAREVVTLEYGTIHSEHPQISTMLPIEFRQRFLNGTLGTFDAVVTFSSVEHSGLGRYGDGLNPWGDLLAVARTWCVAKPGARLVIAVPDGPRDRLVFNAHRVYGPIRYPYLVANWRQLFKVQGAGKTSQSVYVLEKELK
eukprot:g72237.t1